MLSRISAVFFLCFLYLFNTESRAQGFNSEWITTLKSSSNPDKMVEIAKKFLGKPYLAGTLEGPQEKLICRLDGFDCYTYVETVLALTLLSDIDEPREEDFLDMMQILRYRDGDVDGYTSRIHYFFEWTKHAEELEFVQDLTPDFGKLKPLTINFMSNNRQYYSAFKTNNSVLQSIKAMEESLKAYDFYEIQAQELPKIQKNIKNGDIIAFTSNVKGLDVNHEGIAYWKGDKLHFMHASSDLKKVVISDETIEEYIKRIPKHAGLMVVRVL
jgi:hypothetical protein